MLNAEFPGATYLWAPGGEITASITVFPSDTTLYSVTVVAPNGCQTYDDVTLIVDPCLGLEVHAAGTVKLWPVPVTAGELLQTSGSRTIDVLGLFGADGRVCPLRMVPQAEGFSLRTDGMAPGTYVLRLSNGTALPIVVR